MTTQNRSHASTWIHPASDGATETPQTGRYTDVDTLSRGTTRHAVRPGKYTDVDTVTRLKTSTTVRPGSYIDTDALSGSPVPGRPGSYTDVDRSAR